MQRRNTLKKISSQNLWPRINSVINELINLALSTVLFLAAPAMRFLKRDIDGASGNTFPGVFGDFVGH